MEVKPDAPFTNPRVTPFVQCPSCKRLIECEAALCPHCREEIDPQYAKLSKLVVVYQTAAVSSANTIKTAEMGAAIVFVASFIGFWFDPPLIIANLLTPLISVAAVGVWFYRFGRFRLNDEEYLKAWRDMRKSLALWLVLIGVQILAIIYVLKRRS
jgi:RNA polymerase subunit RPABC4/transcription elongation factor Spt4